jgi:hypothetical protein
MSYPSLRTLRSIDSTRYAEAVIGVKRTVVSTPETKSTTIVARSLLEKAMRIPTITPATTPVSTPTISETNNMQPKLLHQRWRTSRDALNNAFVPLKPSSMRLGMANSLTTQNQTRAQSAGMPSTNPARTANPAECEATAMMIAVGMTITTR